MAALPEDITGAEILTRLPVKSILRFRSVCKLWKSIFSDSNFIKSHLNLTSPNPNEDSLIVNRHVQGTSKISVLYSYNLSETTISDVPFHEQSTINLLGSINGLVCLFDLRLNQIILWNPALRQSKKFDISLQQQLPVYICGFSWDPLRNDYKVVLCCKQKNDWPIMDVYFWYVYSCNSDCWRPLPEFPEFPPFPVSEFKSWTPAAIVKGVPFWTPCGSSIVKFEAGYDEFTLLPKLNYAIYIQEEFVLVSWKDCLTALVYDSRVSVKVNIYCLDERYGVWRKMYTVKVRQITSHVKMTLLSCLNDSGDIVFHVFSDVLCYDRKTNKIKGLGSQEGKLVNCYSYKASFVSVDGMEPLHLANPAYM